MPNRLMEITQMLQDANNINRDIDEALSLVKDHFKEKYFKSIQSAVRTQRLKVMEKPPKEVALVNAMKQFAPSEQRHKYDKLIDAVLTINSWAEIQKNLHSAPSKQPKIPSMQKGNDESVHPDGIYDMDKQCLMQINNKSESFVDLMFLMTLLSGVK